MRRFASLALTVALLAACSAESQEASARTGPTPAAERAPVAVGVPDPKRVSLEIEGRSVGDMILAPVSRADLGENWPLTSEAAVIAVRPRGDCAVYVIVSGEAWTVNGWAATTEDQAFVVIDGNRRPVSGSLVLSGPVAKDATGYAVSTVELNARGLALRADCP